MITELNKVDAAIVGGSKVNVVEYNIRNYRLHQVLEQMSRLFLFLLECDSNNTSSKARPRDIRGILSQWNIVKEEMEFSMAHNDFPNGSHEYAFKVVMLDQKEIQKVRNVKMKRLISEMFNTARVILSVDSSNTQGYIAAEDAADVLQMFTLVDDVLARWIGGGTDTADTGIIAPAYEILGELRPDVDGDYASIMEPSSSLPLPKLPDTPDV